MDENPYQPGDAVSRPPRTRATAWLVYVGIGLLGVSAVCLLVSVFGMVLSFAFVRSAEVTPSASSLASGIGLAVLPSVAAIPLALLGIILLVCGFVFRQSVNRES